MRKTILLPALFVSLGGLAVAADSPGQSNWEKFKDGARLAGDAAWSGTKNVAESVGDGAQKAGHAIARGARKTGEAVAEGYEEVKDFVKEKTDGHEGYPEPVVVVPVEPIPEPAPAQ